MYFLLNNRDQACASREMPASLAAFLPTVCSINNASVLISSNSIYAEMTSGTDMNGFESHEAAYLQ